MKLSIVIPMKCPDQAKGRLSEVLTQGERKALALTLFERNLCFFRSRFPEYNLLVVTASEEIRQLAEAEGAEVLQQADSGLNAAVEAAARYNRSRGVESQLVVPGDIETLDQGELATLLDQPRQRGSVVVCPSYDGGTNALLTTPPDAMPFSYGPQSCRAHLLSALQLGLQAKRLYLEKLSFDIDLPSDLFRVAAGSVPKTA